MAGLDRRGQPYQLGRSARPLAARRNCPPWIPTWARAIPRPVPEDLPPLLEGKPELIGHRDITPENVVFREGEAVALIDFDLLGPTTRIEELTNMLLWWAPWIPVSDREPVLQDADHVARTRVMLDAYGLPATERRRLPPVAINLAERTWYLMRWRAEHLGGGWARMWDSGIGEKILRRRAWLEQHSDNLVADIGS